MNEREIRRIVGDIHHPKYRFRVESPGIYRSHTSIVMSCQGKCSRTGKNYSWDRRRAVSESQSKSEIVQMCFAMVLSSEEHEAREQFEFKNAKVFSPHFDIEDLVVIARERAYAGER